MTVQAFGDYSVINKVGEGFFGEVFLVEHRYIKKRYALKILPEELSSDKEFIKNFENHIQTIAKLDHQSIVKIHNISSFEGKYFLVMDAVADFDGNVTDLNTFLKKRSKILNEQEVESILKQIASALDYAHRVPFDDKFLVHRGLKPSNILINETEHGIRVFLTDFAMAKLVGEEKILFKSYKQVLKKLAEKETVESSLFNNFHFLSPEQRNPTSESLISAKADVYSFGILAYYMITRKIPEGYFDLPSKIAPEYKLNWNLLICKCLKNDPQKRPESLTGALNSLLSKEVNDVSNLDVLSWEEVGKKVENAMQMSFEFSMDQLDDDMLTTLDPLSSESDKPKPIIKPQEITRPEYDPNPAAIFQKELNVSFYKPKEVEIKEVEPILTEMTIIPSGEYNRGSGDGSRDEMPYHKIKLNSFALDVHPVTNEQFIRFLDSMGGEKDANNNDIIRLRNSRIKRSGGKLIIEAGYAKHPVVGVPWYGAFAYAKWIGKRLPTEAEWEIASRGGNEEAYYPTGENIDHTQANFFNSDTTAVLSYPPNEYGLYDMAGNVYDWCLDWYAYNYYDVSQQEPDNPKGPLQGVYRVLRGGCWKSLKEDLRCSHRHRNNPGAVMGTYGFRCAADVS